MIACHCEVCKSKDPHDKRLRTSALLEVAGKVLLIDAGPDFRQLLLREDVQQLDAILITHEHKDHTAGLDDVRAFNHLKSAPIDIYAEKRVCESLKREFAYAFGDDRYPGVPDINLKQIDDAAFIAEGIPIQPIRVMHHHLPVYGFRIGNFAYITDANNISAKSMKLLEGVEILVLNALRGEKHLSHFNFEDALAVVEQLKPRACYFTHLSHQAGFHKQLQSTLPRNVFVAYDGLKVDLSAAIPL